MHYFLCAVMLFESANLTPIPDEPGATVQTARYHGRRHQRAARVDESTEPFTTNPFWKCDASTNPNPVHMDFTATPDSRILGGIDQDDGKGGVASTPLEAKYLRQGPKVAVYVERWVEQPRDPSSMSLGRSELKRTPIMILTWDGKGKDGKDNHWTADLLWKKQSLKCTDHVSGSVTDESAPVP